MLGVLGLTIILLILPVAGRAEQQGLARPFPFMQEIEQPFRELRAQIMMATYYRGLQHWPEREVVSKFAFPRFTFAASNDTVAGPVQVQRIAIGPMIAQHRDELERLGWMVRLVDGFGHELVNRPDVEVPLIREFLDPVLLQK
jgi:hypothetical protein